MVAEHFRIQVSSGQNFRFEGDDTENWISNMSKPGVMVDHYWLSSAAKMLNRCIILIPTFTQSSTQIGRIIQVWGGRRTDDSPEVPGQTSPTYLGYMEDNLYTGIFLYIKCP